MTKLQTGRGALVDDVRHSHGIGRWDDHANDSIEITRAVDKDLLDGYAVSANDRFDGLW